MSNSRRILSQAGIAVAAFLLAASLQALAFTEPSQNPPGGNVAAPINTGPVSQDKTGSPNTSAWITADGLGSRYGALLATVSGNVGIGTISPAGSLDVENANKTATLCLNGSCTTSVGGSVSRGSLGPNRQVFNASGIWTKPSGYGANAAVLIRCWGGGGGGSSNGGGNGSGGGGGGGGEGYAEEQIALSSLPESVSITVGAAGSGSDVSSPGGNGGTTSFGAVLSAGGGAGGQSAGAALAGGVGGAGGVGSGSGGMTGGNGDNGGNGDGISLYGNGGNGGAPGGGSGGVWSANGGASGRCIITTIDGS